MENSANNERRRKPRLRAIFDEACWLVTPFFVYKTGGVDSKVETYARQALREAYPDLSVDDISALFAAVQRFHLRK